MDKVVIKCQVYFENPFWVGVCERNFDGKLSVCKITFGPEPKDYEVAEFILNNWYKLKFSPTIGTVVKQREKVNPKRLQREVKRQLTNVGVGTKSQEALRMLQEENKILRKNFTRKQRDEEKKRKFALKQQKKKEKHKGR